MPLIRILIIIALLIVPLTAPAAELSSDVPLNEWLGLPVGMHTPMGYLACPMSNKTKDWLTFGRFIENIYEKEQEKEKKRSQIAWRKGNEPDTWIMTMSQKDPDTGKEIPNTMVFKRLVTGYGNTIVGIEKVIPGGVEAPREILADMWNDACISHGGLGWKNVK